MNRENKRKLFDKNYYKKHPCNEPFICKNCGRLVVETGAGTQHLDDEPGDRAANCGGVMEPVAVWIQKNGEWKLIHRCKICGVLHSNRIAADDNPLKLMSLAMKPLAAPPFPLDKIEEIFN